MPKKKTNRISGPLREVLTRALSAPRRRRTRLEPGHEGAEAVRARRGAWAIALSVHLAALLVIGVVAFGRHAQRGEMVFEVAMRPAGEFDFAIFRAPPDRLPAPPAETDADEPPTPPPDAAGAMRVGASGALTFEDVLADRTAPAADPAAASDAPEPQGAHMRSRPSTRRQYMDARHRAGALLETDAGLARALDWLVRHQRGDGRWGGLRTVKCSTPDLCLTAKVEEGHAGVTALAALALSGAHADALGGKYDPALRLALNSLSERQAPDGCLVPKLGGYLYEHGFATLAFVEAMQSGASTAHRPTMERAVKFVVDAQQDNGGWDYTHRPSGRADVCVSTVQVMALRAAADAGLAVPAGTLRAAREFFERLARTDGTSGYAEGGPGADKATRGTIASAYLARLYLGTPLDDPWMDKARGLLLCWHSRWDDLRSALPDRSNTLYFWFLAAQGLIHSGPDAWRGWNARLQHELLEAQRTSGRCSDGSWDSSDPWLSDRYGPIFATAMGALILETYTRQSVEAVFPEPLKPVRDLLAAHPKPSEVRALFARALAEHDHSLLDAELPDGLPPLDVLECCAAAQAMERNPRHETPFQNNPALRAAWQECLHDHDPATRKRAAELTPGLVRASWYPTLAQCAVAERDAEIKVMLLNALHGTPERSLLEPALVALEDSRPPVACAALRLVRDFGLKSRIDECLALCGAANPDVQRDAIEATLALKTYADEEVRARVLNWMQHRDVDVREAAKDWLAEWHRQQEKRGDPIGK